MGIKIRIKVFGLIGIMLYKLTKVILFSMEANETQTIKHKKITPAN